MMMMTKSLLNTRWEDMCVYEDDQYAVMNKPHGLATLEDRASPINVLKIVREKYPTATPCHRLDKETSGVLILVKNQETFLYFKKLFKERRIKKTYVAFVEGKMKAERGIIDKPIGRSPRDFRRRLAGRGARGEMREAITQYKVVQGLDGFSYLEVFPKTGRTHQIRVHMKFVNHPILCDKLYNPKGLCPASLGRLALHAKAIEFDTSEGKKVHIESPIPVEFGKMIELKSETKD